MQTTADNRSPHAPPRSAPGMPNFVLGGAPKCGTTAMAGYLRSHPAVWFSDPKEPFYWATDLPALRRREKMLGDDAYAKLFRGAGSEHTAIGEGSTLYLFSTDAITNILARAPDMKFLFMIRRPDEIAHAFHMQMQFHYFEDEPDFETAWRRQPERAAGQRIPLRCLEPRLLQYRQVAQVGSQLRRAGRLIPPENLLVLLFDDFRDAPRATYLRALEFLRLADDGRQQFPKENSAMQPRAAWLTQTLRSHAARSLVRKVKSLPLPLSGVIKRATGLVIRKRAERQPLAEPFRQELIREFSTEVDQLEQLLDSNLSHWRK